MKKTLTGIYLLFLVSLMPLCAQTSLQTVLSNMQDSAVEMEYSYALTSSGVKTTGIGTVVSQDSLYRMSASGLVIVCDGKTVWVMDDQGKEVMIESVSEGEQNFMNNPAMLLYEMDSFFKVDGMRSSDSQTVYVLSPKVECGVSGGTVTVGQASSSPVFTSCSFSLSDGSKIDIEIKSMAFLSKKPLTFFFLDISALDSSWLITDLR